MAQPAVNRFAWRNTRPFVKKPMNRRRGKHLCRIREQNQLRHSVVAVPDSGILGLQAEEDVKRPVSLNPFLNPPYWYAWPVPALMLTTSRMPNCVLWFIGSL